MSLFVVKVGGSLIDDRKNINAILDLLIEIAEIHKIVLLSGGGSEVDKVREKYSQNLVGDIEAHWKSIEIMDNNTKTLSEYSKKIVFNESINNEDFMKNNIISAVRSREILKKSDLPENWDITSDSIAYYISEIIKADGTVLLKDVDGIYEKNSRAYIKEININEAESFAGCGIDKYLPSLLKKHLIPLYFINGKYIDRIKDFFVNDNLIGTKIV